METYWGTKLGQNKDKLKYTVCDSLQRVHIFCLCCVISINTFFMWINTIGARRLLVWIRFRWGLPVWSLHVLPVFPPGAPASSHKHMQVRGCVNWRLHTSCCCFSLWILRTQLSLRPHTLSSSHSAPLRLPPPSVERRRHQCYRDSLHQLWVSDAAHPVERAAGTSVLFRGGAASSLLHVHVLEWTR